MRWSGLMVAAYLAMISWQIIWHGVLPPPRGSGNPGLAIIACLPLLIPLAGLIRQRYRSMIWGGVILMLYLAIGFMEVWVNPPQRLPALIQILLAAFYLFAFRQRNQNL